MLRREYLKTLFGAAAAASPESNGAANVEVVRQLVAGCFDEGNLAAADRLLAAGYRCSGSFGEWDRERWKEAVSQIAAQYSGVRVRVAEMLAVRDRVTWRWTLEGVERSTGQRTALEGVSIERLAAGRIVESYVLADVYGCLSRMDALRLRQTV